MIEVQILCSVRSCMPFSRAIWMASFLMKFLGRASLRRRCSPGKVVAAGLRRAGAYIAICPQLATWQAKVHGHMTIGISCGRAHRANRLAVATVVVAPRTEAARVEVQETAEVRAELAERRRPIVTVRALVAEVAVAAITSGRKEDRVAVRTRNLVAVHFVLSCPRAGAILL